MKRFISVVNNTTPFGKALNGLSHTAVGIGHRIPQDKMPGIEIFFAHPEILRAFRKVVCEGISKHPEKVIRSEFTNTMSGRETEYQLALTKKTTENQIEYYAVSACADQDILASSDFEEIFKKCVKMKHYHPYHDTEKARFSFKRPAIFPNYRQLPDNKIAIILDRNVLIAELINPVVQSSVEIGKQAQLDQLKLLIYENASGETHPYISYHPIAILATKKSAKFNDLAGKVSQDEKVISHIVSGDPEQGVRAAAILGEPDDVNAHSYQKFISVWAKEPSPDTFEYRK